jgi:hypothetical protein
MVAGREEMEENCEKKEIECKEMDYHVVEI